MDAARSWLVRNARILMAELLTDTDAFFGRRGCYPFVACDGPSELTLIDGLKEFHRGQRLATYFCFDRWTIYNLDEALAYVREGRKRSRINEAAAHLVGAYRLPHEGGLWIGAWAIVVEIIDGPHSGQFLVGMYEAKSRTGIFATV